MRSVKHPSQILLFGLLAHICSSFTSVDQKTATKPDPPMNVTATTMPFSATISWTAGHDGGSLQHFVLWFRKSDGGDNAWRTIRVHPDGITSYTVTKLNPNTDYDFHVLSVNRIGDGGFSKMVTATTKPDLTTPALPSTTEPTLTQLKELQTPTLPSSCGKTKGNIVQILTILSIGFFFHNVCRINLYLW